MKQLDVTLFDTLVLYMNIDQKLVNSLHRLLNCEIGGLDCRVITEYRACVHIIHMYHLFCNALVHLIYSGVSGQCSFIIYLNSLKSTGPCSLSFSGSGSRSGSNFKMNNFWIISHYLFKKT